MPRDYNSFINFSCLVISDSLWPYELQGTRLPWPPPPQLPELAQTRIHWVGNVIQPCHPLLSPSLPTFNLSQHQGHFQWVSSLHQVAKVLELHLQHQSFQWILSTDFLWIHWFVFLSLICKGLSRVFSTPKFKNISSLVLSFLYSPILTSIHDYWKNHRFD